MRGSEGSSPGGLEPTTVRLTVGVSPDATPVTPTVADNSPPDMAQNMYQGHEPGPDLSRVVAAWPTLSADARAAVLKLIAPPRRSRRK